MSTIRILSPAYLREMILAHWQLSHELRFMPVHVGYWGNVALPSVRVRSVVSKIIVIHSIKLLSLHYIALSYRLLTNRSSSTQDS